jgi:hypothetical protein
MRQPLRSSGVVSSLAASRSIIVLTSGSSLRPGSAGACSSFPSERA